jgi:hypothetical protein
VLLRTDLDGQQNNARGGFVEHLIHMNAKQQSVTKILCWNFSIWSHYVVLLQPDLDGQQNNARGQFVEHLIHTNMVK